MLRPGISARFRSTFPHYQALRRFGALLLCSLLSIGTAVATENPPAAGMGATEPHQRPKVGLVLSGGGARGAAHIGVLKVLHELRVPIDYVVGTSMGAVIGGLYASGMSPEEIERELLAQDWQATFKDLPNRPQRPFRRKNDDRLYLVKFKPGFNNGRIELPIAAIQGQNFDLVLNRLTLGVAEVASFDQLAIPYRAVATDITTGEAVVLDHGNLARAMRASLAVPGVFAPVEIGGRLLVDGGVSDNLPIDVARQMGAEVLIVVNISTGLAERKQLQSVLGIVNQLTTLLTYRGTAQQLETLRSEDILISPDLGNLTSGDFKRVGEAVPIGEAAAQAAAGRLRALSLPPERFARYEAGKRKALAAPPIIDFIRIDNRSRLDDAMIAVRLNQRLGQPLDVEQLQQDLSQLYALEVFESVRYELVREDGRTGLLVRAVEKSWGPNFVQFGFNLAADLEGDSDFNAAVAYTWAELNRLNGEARVAVQIGERPLAILDVYQPLDVASRYFAYGQLRARQRVVSQYRGGHLVSEFKVREFGGEAGGGRNLGQWGEFRLGYRLEDGRADVRVSELGEDDFRFTRGELRTSLAVDTLDKVEFPRHGTYSQLEWVASREALGGDEDFDQLLFSVTRPYAWGRNTVLGSVFYQTTLADDAPIQSLFTTGGFLRLSGLVQDELAGQ
ncbi:MAG TPA: patatin-like phospholipase family protein, partial [Gammaproteobacteria bacterium]|nr:patatin-like phospholipase family protein [Gammaproteobacteria bacterium]